MESSIEVRPFDWDAGDNRLMWLTEVWSMEKHGSPGEKEWEGVGGGGGGIRGYGLGE